MKLLVRYKKRPPFHPRLTIERTGWSGDRWQWCETHFRSGCTTGGGDFVSRMSVREAVEHYFRELRRMHYEDVTGRVDGRSRSR